MEGFKERGAGRLFKGGERSLTEDQMQVKDCRLHADQEKDLGIMKKQLMQL